MESPAAATSGTGCSGNELPPAPARGWPLLPIVLFFVSGAAALIYEISWTRQIGLVLGQTADAAAILLASYMGGMALGYRLGERWKARVAPLRGYALAELAVAAWACVVPLLLVASRSSASLLVSHQSGVQAATRIAFCGIIFLPATAALGATLPFMAAIVSPGRGRSGAWVFLAYTANTAGAFAGVLVATFWLLGNVGVRTSSLIAGGGSAACGALALVLDRSVGLPKPIIPAVSPLAEPPTTGRLRYTVIAAVSGFVTLALEVLFTRLFSLVFHNSTYTFGVVIAAFLLALAAASALFAGLSRRFSAASLLVVSGLGGAAAIVGSVWLFVRVTRFEYFEWGESFGSYVFGAFGLALLIVAPPVILLGMILPGAWRVMEAEGDAIGRLTAVNTVAAAAGALIASLGLRPTFGLWGAFWVVATLSACIPLAIVQRRVSYAVIATAILVPCSLLTSRAANRALLGGIDAGKEIIQRWESAYGWIDVVHDVRNDRWQVRQNLHYSHGASGSTATRERRQGHLPLLLHPKPRQVAFLGLGTGITASAVRSHEDVERTVIVELIPEVVDAARLIGQFNDAILNSPNTEIRIDDARHFLSASRDHFDVIVADLYVPWESQTGYLYTSEHFSLVRNRLSDGGLFCQWLPLYQMGADEFVLIADTFAATFPQTSLWWGQIDTRRPIVALIGSESPLQAKAADLSSRLVSVAPLASGGDPYLATAELISDLCAGGWPNHPGVSLNTDEHPRVEFLAPVSHRCSEMLSRKTLRAWFDDVLSTAPNLNLDGLPTGAADAEFRRRREWSRFLLFGT